MSRLVIAALFVFGLLIVNGSAQDVKDGKAKSDGKGKVTEAPAKKGIKLPTGLPGEVDIHFLNGSTVRMIIHSDQLEIATAYGKLAVPVKDVRAIEFGLHFPEGVEGKIETAIKKLGSSDYRERETATKDLIELAPFSYPAILDASRTKELETAQRAKELVKKLQAVHPKKDLKTGVDDKIVTKNFTIVGRILTTSIKTKTEYFGEVELGLAKMRTLRAVGTVGLDSDVVIDAAKYAAQGQWMDTGFVVDGRSQITINAKGIIDVWPQQGGSYLAGPNGWQYTQRGGGFPGGGGMGQPFYLAGKKITAVNQNQHCGMLIARIGEDGEMFVVGERYEGTPESEGKLYLTIGPSQWNSPSSGTFDVKIARKE